MATARRVASNENVQTYGNGTRDFTSLSTWEAATDIDLVGGAQSEVLECFDDAADFDDDIIADGATTNSSFFRIIRPAPGEGHDGTPNNGVFFRSTTSSNVFRFEESFFSLQDVIISHVFSSSSTRDSVQLTGADCSAIGVICFDNVNSGSGGARGFDLLDPDVICVDCIAINCGSRNYRIDPGGGNTAYMYNCVSIDASGDGVGHSGGTAVCKNVLSTGSGGDDFDAGGTFTGSLNNASGDATAPGTGSRINQTFTFVNAAGDDYHLDSGDGGAKDFGIDLSADSFFAFDDDIDGDTFGTAVDLFRQRE